MKLTDLIRDLEAYLELGDDTEVELLAEISTGKPTQIIGLVCPQKLGQSKGDEPATVYIVEGATE
jgi:hypothetical protein